MTSLLQKINELNVRVDNVSTSGGGGTTDTTALQAQIDTNTTDISGIQLHKQNTLVAGDNITIVNNIISSSGVGSVSGSSNDVVGFRAAGDGTFSRDVILYTYLSGSLKVYDNQEHSTFDKHSGYQGNAYTIPTGYGDWWDLNLKIYMFNYNETLSVVSIRKGSEVVLQSGDYQGQLADFSSIIKVEEGDVMSVYQEAGSGRYSFLPTRSWWSMRFIASSI